jgi:hypothetical protein
MLRGNGLYFQREANAIEEGERYFPTRTNVCVNGIQRSGVRNSVWSLSPSFVDTDSHLVCILLRCGLDHQENDADGTLSAFGFDEHRNHSFLTCIARCFCRM